MTYPKVHLLTATPNAEKVIAVAAKQCYQPVDATDIFKEITQQEIEHIIQHCICSGHLSILAHAHAVFAVSNCSRSFLAQVTRHSFIKPSVQSQHFINHSDFTYTIPTTVENNQKALEIYEKTMQITNEAYKQLIGLGIPKEDARQVLPNAVEARMILSGTLWAWFEMLPKRLCLRNTEEIRLFAADVLKQLRKIAPTIFSYCSKPCDMHKCKEVNPCDWYYIKKAYEVGVFHSNCKRKYIGAVIKVKNSRQIVSGYNEIPPEKIHECDNCPREHANAPGNWDSENTCSVVHAEIKAIEKAKSFNIDITNSTLYCTYLPCMNCAAKIVESGIKRVVFDETHQDYERVKDFLLKHNVVLDKMSRPVV